jgi:uracil-DNA glycosylase
VSGPFSAAVAAFCSDPASGAWRNLPFFRDGTAAAIAARVDERLASRAEILPPPQNVLTALRETPLSRVRAVILGQDPYPTPGDAHGLAFSYRGSRRLPASLRVILSEMAADLDMKMPASGDLTSWAEQGVLLLNTALTVEAGRSGAHLGFGWQALTDQVIAAVSAHQPAVAFLLWGQAARTRNALIDESKHLVIESGHPSPLNRKNDFRGTRPFSRANAFLEAKGCGTIDWRLD